MFTLVLTGPILVLYFSSVFAAPARRPYIALVNAVGTTLGVAILVFLIQQNGTEWVKFSFPSVFQGRVWEMTQAAFQQYGVIGGFLISCLPVVLHPLIFIALLTGMNVVTLLATIFAGRIVKYLVMAQLAATMPHLLRKLGSGFQRALDTAQQKQD
jgi:membrane protein YqaA with SNARE-associated domain